MKAIQLNTDLSRLMLDSTVQEQSAVKQSETNLFQDLIAADVADAGTEATVQSEALQALEFAIGVAAAQQFRKIENNPEE